MQPKKTHSTCDEDADRGILFLLPENEFISWGKIYIAVRLFRPVRRSTNVANVALTPNDRQLRVGKWAVGGRSRHWQNRRPYPSYFFLDLPVYCWEQNNRDKRTAELTDASADPLEVSDLSYHRHLPPWYISYVIGIVGAKRQRTSHRSFTCQKRGGRALLRKHTKDGCIVVSFPLLREELPSLLRHLLWCPSS